MKKMSFLVALLFCCLCIFADQITYRRDSEEVQTYYELRHLCSTQSPDPVFPITGSQLLDLVKELDSSKLESYGQQLYSKLISELEEPQHDFSYKDTWLDLELPFYATLRGRTSDTYIDELMEDYMLFNMQNTKTGHGIDAKLSIGENFAGRFNFCLQVKDTEKFRNQKLLFISPFFAFKETDEDHKPFNTYVSVGNDKLNLIVGRDRTSAGNGKTGNIAFGDNFIYQDFAKISAVSYPFSYDLTVYEYDNQKDSNFNLEPLCHDEPFQLVVSHRLSVALTKFLNITAYESTLTYGDTYAVIKAINPFQVLHNTYAFRHSNNNNFCGAEVNASIKNFEVSLNIMLDQWQFPGEISNQGGPGEIAPNALAIQLNTTGVWEFEKGILEAYAEGVYTSPVCYLKEIKGKDKNGVYWYQQDLLVGNNYSNFGNVEFLGYKYGPNTIALGFGGSYKEDKWNISADLMLMERGSYGKRHDMIIFGNSKTQKEMWTEEDLERGIDKLQYTFALTDEESKAYLNLLHKPIVFNDEELEYTVKATIKGSYKFDESFSLNGGLGFISVKNYCNQRGKTFNDFQFTIGVKLDAYPWIAKFTGLH